MPSLNRDWPNLRTLELFVAVVDEGSLGAGARRVGMAQPNASKAIVELESSLQADLLERRPTGSVPTAFGLNLAAHARELLEAAQEFQAWSSESQQEWRMTLSVGASMTIAETLLPAWIAKSHKRFPDAHIAISVLNSADVIAQVQQGNLELGFIETPHVPVRVHSRVVQEDELFLAIGPQHQWASRTGHISLQELANTPLVVREPGSGTYEALQDLLADYSPVEPAQVFGSNAAVRVAVQAGAGPALLSELALRDHLANGHLLRVPLEGDKITRPLTAIWTGPRRMAKLARELVAIAENHPLK